MVANQTRWHRWLGRVKTMLTQPIKLPGWAAIALFIYTAIPDNISRVGFWIDVTKATG